MATEQAQAEKKASDPRSIAVITGMNVPRIDGSLKVTGRAQYTSDHNFEDMVYAVPVGAKIAKGKVKSIDSSAAKSMKGVIAVYTHGDLEPLYRPTSEEEGFTFKIDEPRPAFEDTIIRYYGQYVAVVVAETFEIAQNAAKALKIAYDVEKPNLEDKLEQEDLKKTDSQRGDAEKAFAAAPVKIDHTYVTSPEVHNPIEMHATVAVWDFSGDEPKVTLYETSQAVGTHQNVLAQVLGMPKENVRVLSKFLGSGFGGKLWAWPHSAIAAASARKLKRPVKLVLDRHMMFTNVGYRPRTQQQVKIGADSGGKLLSLQHDYATQTDMLGAYKENCGEVSGFLYSVANVKVTSGVARRNKGSPTSMRGPGAVPGLFALESALDELAVALKMDPVQLRILNDTLIDESSGRPFSSRHFKECLELGAQKFGWDRRTPGIGSMRSGDEIIGFGVSGCTWSARRLDSAAMVEFRADGKIVVKCGTHDIGTGMYTVLAQLVHDETGVPMERIEVLLGDSSLPAGPLAGGSMATGSVIPAIMEAVKAAKKNVIGGATKSKTTLFAGQKPEELKFENGVVSSPKGKQEFGALVHSMNMGSVAGMGNVKGSAADKNPKFTTKSFGAQFVEIGWNPDLARLKVRRVVTVIDGGKIINLQPARNQIEGAIIMGIGMGMFEQSEYDPRYGHPANGNLADYIVASHADCPDIDVTFLDYPDKAVNELGARGVGEIGLAGVASSICSAVYHATGVRVRELPVTIEKLLKPLV